MDFLKKLNQDLIKKSNELGEEINKQVNSTVLKIRTQVSENNTTIRFKDGEFDLDLSYITERIIAMSFPSEDTVINSTWYRNSRVDVKKMLDKYHRDHYLIINLTEKSYDSSFFGGRVHHIGCVDNHSPSLGLLLYAVQVIHKWLSEDPKNVVAIHCLAGLGRSGTLIVAYLLTSLYEGRKEEALQLFASQRTTSKVGVKVPSQLRYIDYVHQLVTSKRPVDVVQNPMKLRLNAIMIKPSPVVSGKSGQVWKPTIEIFNVMKPLEPHLLFSTKDLDGPFNKNQNDAFCKVQGDVVIIETQSLVLQGDVLIKIYHGFSDILSKEVLNVIMDKPSLRLAFHTSFIDNHCLDLNKFTLDEKDNCIQSDKFSQDFSLRLLFSPYQEQQQQPQPQPQQQQPQQPQQQYQPANYQLPQQFQQPQQQQQPQHFQQSQPQQPQYQPQHFQQQQQQQPPQYQPPQQYQPQPQQYQQPQPYQPQPQPQQYQPQQQSPNLQKQNNQYNM
ncbi:hypothetical protein ACTFIY_003560 [Dictyostelium cf. discoideum]